MKSAFLLIFARCVGFTFRAPGFSHPSVPPPVRAGFAYVLALGVAHAISKNTLQSPGTLVFGVMCEALLGAALGIAASMFYDGAYAGGHIVDDYIGIKVNVPSAGIVAPSGFGRLWSQAFITGFFVLGGYAVMIPEFTRTFDVLPPGALLAVGDIRMFAYTLPTMLLRSALLIAAPAVAIAFIVQFALAAVSRVVVRLSVFSLSFAFVFACVLLITLVTIMPVTRTYSAPQPSLLRLLLHAHG
jgi:flagellar biosynthesis protein FliR